MSTIREPAVAGMFYESDAKTLKSDILSLMKNLPEEKYKDIFGIVVPHAGYIYSGRTAAFAYNVIKQKKIKTAIIISPSHREYFPGICIFNGDAYKTPLGLAEIDTAKSASLISKNNLIFEGTNGHKAEHAVEVHLPFLQMINEKIKIVPAVMGDQRKEFVDALAEAVAAVWDEETVVIASSDLSHFYSSSVADKLDAVAEKKITDFDYEGFQKALDENQCEACGGGGISALLKAADTLGFKKSKILSRTHSGMVSGKNHEVVGYLSAVIYGRNDE